MMLTGGIVTSEVLTNSMMSCRKRPMSPHMKEYCHSRKTFHSGFSDGAQLSNGLSKHESSADVDHDSSTSVDNPFCAEKSDSQISVLQEKWDCLKLLQKQLSCEEAKLILLRKLRSSQLLLYTQQTTHVRTVDTKTTNDINAKQHSYSHPMTKNKPVAQQHRQNQIQRPSPSNFQVHNKTHQPSHPTPFGVLSNAQPPRPQHAQHYRSNAHMQRPPPVETAEQRYATAKLHMKRNLEKMLLSVPLPKSPQVDFTFIPSLASMEFQTLLGLEETVRFLKDGLYKRASNVEKSIPPAFFCAQCKTSCSPLWRRLPESSEVICEKCAKHNQKKIAKAEHASKLRNAFSKVAQQEKEFEQKFQSESMNFTMNNVANIPNVSNPSISSSLASQPAAYFPLTSEHLKFYQTQILRSSTFPSLLPGVTLPFMTSTIAAALSGKGSESNAQYLLDMIPTTNNKQSTRSSDSYKKC